jgi:hypothetical protein
MREALAQDDERRLDAIDWLHGAALRGVQIDVEHRDVALYAVVGEDLIEVLCEDSGYVAMPNLMDCPEQPRIVGLVVQPLGDAAQVRLEFSNHPAQIHLHCARVLVRRYPPGG